MYLKKINLKNKIALVTGAGKGIGKACAIALAEADADLIIISRTQKDLDNVSKIIKKFKSKCSTFTCDVTNYNQVKNIIRKQKKIDILVNKMLETKNRKKIGASIINISSQMGHVGGQIRSVYNMTKFGLEGLTKGMAIDLAKNNIRVNTVCPTFVDTPMTKRFFKNNKFKREIIEKIPLGRIAGVSDVATTVAFLASDASSMITGTSILIDGGWTAK